MLWNIWFEGRVICEESNGWHRLQGLGSLFQEAVISHFLSSSAPCESPLISSGLGLITSTERHGNTAEMLYLAHLGRDSKFFKLPSSGLLTDRWLCARGASAGLIYGLAGGFILWWSQWALLNKDTAKPLIQKDRLLISTAHIRHAFIVFLTHLALEKK